jgi:uncharacterized protein (TIGR02996 family)
MHEDAEFLKAIRAAPADDLPRLVYADWLDERGRPGGEFLRIDCQIAALDPTEDERRQQDREKMRQEGIELPPPNFLDEYFWKRTHLVASLRVAASGLDDEWMSELSRVPIDEVNARNREIQSWLRKRIAVSDYLAAVAECDKPPTPPKGLWKRFRDFFRRSATDETDFELEGPAGRAGREWIEANLRPGDELWEYDSGGDSWANLHGEMGYAIVRNGKVVEFDMRMMN